MLKVQRALLSVYDKQGIVQLARGLSRLGIEILSTGGTLKRLTENDVPALSVSEVTGFPEILDGRVKTLHPAVHGGILADRGRAGHVAQLRQHGIAPIDLVVVNLYPFRHTAAEPGASPEAVIDMIDIGGPCMVRAAAKNHLGVVVIVDPEDYPQVLAALEEGDGIVPESLRRRLAVKAFRHTQSYDAAIADWLERGDGGDAELFPAHRMLDLERQLELRYGENPHQRAALYRRKGSPGIFGGFEQLQGKELSFNNLLDADAARRLAASFRQPAVAIIKHNNPCGVGIGETAEEAYRRALECDPVSAFGSVIATNTPLDGALADSLGDLFVEVLIAPECDSGARSRLSSKPSLRLLVCPLDDGGAEALEYRALEGGFLAQTPDTGPDEQDDWTCVTRRRPTEEELEALRLGWAVVRHVRSNAIVVSNRVQTVGIGAGQMSRVDSCHLAVDKARIEVSGCAAASDAFFPFRDGLDVLADAGISALVQPGGSKRDPEVIAAADERELAMLFTGRRHFRH